MQIKEVKVCFKNNPKAYSFDASQVYIKLNDIVVVQTVRGLEIGTICSHVKTIEDSSLIEPLKPIIRIATEEDLEKDKQNQIKQQEIKLSCEEIANKLNLNLKVISAELSFDCSKVIIYFSAENRVDFRELVKQMAYKYKLRIELRQVDSREETKIIGGLGPCGRECCCYSFLKEAEHSNIKMAKNQNVSLNPSSLNGLCGKIKCCLSYENETYAEAIKMMPQIKKVVQTPEGNGEVVYNNLLKKIVSVKLTAQDGSFNIKDFPLEQIKIIGE